MISESGIHTCRSARAEPLRQRLPDRPALMEQADLEAAVKRVLLGENKVCGLTRPQDAQWPGSPAPFTVG
ncbi:hypothetical protein J4734_13190 [Klebsiella pneumoniae]|uniref:Uncharacterized protein n=1 Tax=Klebsiella pneumoniae TaxID=573 RepID=A0A939NSD7_KLEPN|nr:hypothetical protein [Klebsiella pneumoniae]